MNEMKEVKGIIEGDVEGDSPKRIKVDRYYYSYFGDVEIKAGDYIEGEYYEKDNPKNPEYPYKTIPKLEVKDKPKGYEETRKLAKERQEDLYELGMAKNNAATLLGHIISGTGTPPQMAIEHIYPSLVKDLFTEGKKLRKELLED